MDLWVLILLALFLWQSKLSHPIQAVHSDYLSPKNCMAWRGILSLLVICHHLSQNTSSGVLFPWFRQVGCIAVAMFFFYSSYGLQVKHMSSPSYQKHFLLHRLPTIYVPYLLATIFYWVGNMLLGTYYPVSRILRCFVFLDPIVSNSWYIITIFVFYVAFYFIMLVSRDQYRALVPCCMLYAVGWYLACTLRDKGVWWYNATHAVVLGSIWAVNKEKLTKFINRYYILFFPIVLLGFAFLFVYRPVLPISGFKIDVVLTILFPLCIIMYSMKVQIGNVILNFLGKISFELYMVHGFFLYALHSDLINISGDFRYSLCVVGCSIVVATAFHYLDTWLLAKIKRGISHIVKD